MIKEIIVAPLEAIAGREYPFYQDTAYQNFAGDQHVSMTDIDYFIAGEKAKFREDLVHLRGLQRVVDNIRERISQ